MKKYTSIYKRIKRVCVFILACLLSIGMMNTTISAAVEANNSSDLKTDYERLLYQYPKLTKIDTQIHIDGLKYEYDAYGGEYNELQKTFISSNTFSGVNIKQELVFWESDEEGEDAVQIKHTIYNNTNKCVDVDIMMKMDSLHKIDSWPPSGTMKHNVYADMIAYNRFSENLYPNEEKVYVINCCLCGNESLPSASLGVYMDTVVKQIGVNRTEIELIGYVKNNSNNNLYNVLATIALPEDLTLDIGENETINIDGLEKGEEICLNWKLILNTNSPSPLYTIEVILDADGCAERVVEKTVQVRQEKKAILVVPGIMGSNLIDSKNPDEVLWVNEDWGYTKTLFQVMMRKIDCYPDGTSKNKDIVPLTGENEYGAKKIYEKLITALRNEYGNAYDVVFVPYDWRMQLEDGAKSIEEQIKKYDEVSIVAHSMGGLVVEKYIATRGNDKINKVITLGTPYWGAPMAFKALYTGNISALPELAAMAVEDIMLPIVVNFTGICELLPNEHYTNVYRWLAKEGNQINHWWDLLFYKPVYIEYDWEGTKAFYKTWFHKSLVEVALNDHNQIYPWHSYSPIDTVDCTMIVSKGINTTVGTEIIYTTDLSRTVNMLVSKSTKEGDGTVPFISATMNRINYYDLLDMPVQRIGDIIVLDQVDHINLVSNDTAIKQVKDVLDEAFGIESTVQDAVCLVANAENIQKNNETEYKILLAADCDVDIMNKYDEHSYYHQSDNCVMLSESVQIEYTGTFGELPITMTTMSPGEYLVCITSNINQDIQFAISIGNKIYCFENYELLTGDKFYVRIDKDEKCEFSKNEESVIPVLIVDGEVSKENEQEAGEIMANEIKIESRNMNSSIRYSNTINPQIKMTNNSNKDIELKYLSLEYTFNGDGWTEHVYESDWEAINYQYRGRVSSGRFYVNEDGDYVLKIEFPESKMKLQPGQELEIHCRIHTSNWEIYDVSNDISQGGSQYEENGLIKTYYKDIFIK